MPDVKGKPTIVEELEAARVRADQLERENDGLRGQNGKAQPSAVVDDRNKPKDAAYWAEHNRVVDQAIANVAARKPKGFATREEALAAHNAITDPRERAEFREKHAQILGLNRSK